jgi:hypothetical protein
VAFWTAILWQHHCDDRVESFLSIRATAEVSFASTAAQELGMSNPRKTCPGREILGSTMRTSSLGRLDTSSGKPAPKRLPSSYVQCDLHSCSIILTQSDVHPVSIWWCQHLSCGETTFVPARYQCKGSFSGRWATWYRQHPFRKKRSKVLVPAAGSFPGIYLRCSNIFLSSSDKTYGLPGQQDSSLSKGTLAQNVQPLSK